MKKTLKDFKKGFFILDKNCDMCSEEWVLDDRVSTENKLNLLGYDANFYPLPNFSTRPDNKWTNYVKEYLTEKTKDFDGEVWIDDVRIK